MIFPASELVLDDKGRVYHLGLLPENISTKIILVGDQGRVEQVSSFFETIEHRSQHREFVTQTGVYKGKRITVLSTGIGTDNIDITINELDALANIDLHQRTKKNEFTQLEIVRIGTCGILQANIPIHSYLLSEAAFGLDNVAHFYEIPYTAEELMACDQLENYLNLPDKIKPYYINSDKELIEKLQSDKVFKGITVTSSGFYGPQGRQLNLKTNTTELNHRLTNYTNSEQKIINFEMESSALFSLSRALGHKSTTICLGIANRPNMEFSKGYEVEMNGLICYVLDLL